MTVIAASIFLIALLTTDAPPAAPPASDPLVEAAKKAKAARKGSTTKVITNKDVKKARGTLIVTNPPPVPESEPDPFAKMTASEFEILRQKRRVLDEVVEKAAAKVSELERALYAAEQRYFEENDPDVRDKELTRRFAEVRQELDAAVGELNTAREERAALDPKTP